MDHPQLVAQRSPLWHKRWLLLAGLVSILGLALFISDPAMGQAAGNAATSAPVDGVKIEANKVPSIADLFLISPFINFPLAAMSIVASIIFLYLMLTVTTRSYMPSGFVDDVTRLVINRQFDQASNLCQNNRGIFSATIIQRCLESRDKDTAVMLAIQQAEGKRRAERLWGVVGYISEIANIAPMLGLLGTVIGMIRAFFTLDTRTPSLKSQMLAQNIAEAMGTTMFGLIVAITAGIFFTIIRNRATRVLTDVEQVCQTLADHTHRAYQESVSTSDDTNHRG